MRTRRWLIASFVVLTTGVSLLFGYCNGTAGFSAGYPISGTSLRLDITTTGYPAIIGFIQTLNGLFLLIISVIAAIVAEIRFLRPKPKMEKVADPA
jgi:uncharacterized membrane protein